MINRVICILFLLIFVDYANAVGQSLKIETNIRDFPFTIDDGKIILEIESSKQTIKIGDDFTLTYRIINNSSSDITILPTLIWRDNEFTFYNSNGSEIRMGSTVDIVWSQYIGKDDFINIKAGQCYEAFIPVKSGHHKIELSIFNESGRLYDGHYIYFESTEWYIFLENVDELIIQ
ncbi:MAG: hypothetical protein LBV52_02360, partial [Spirochaetaceae bacterium]|nr:hypothetical protein [Spirochaetaceae bacterium]